MVVSLRARRGEARRDERRDLCVAANRPNCQLRTNDRRSFVRSFERNGTERNATIEDVGQAAVSGHLEA